MCPRCCGRRGRRRVSPHRRSSCTTLDGDWSLFTAQRHILLFRRIEIGKCEQRQVLLVLVRRNYHLESFRSADTNFVILLELGRRWIFMPAAVIFEQRCIHPIEIAATRNRCCDRDRITYFHALRLGIACHGEASNCSRETRRGIWRQRFYFERYRFTGNLDFAAFAKLSKWVREKRIGKRIVEIEKIERRTRTRRISSSGNDHLSLCFDRSDFKFPRSRCGDRSFKRHYVERSAINCFQILRGLLQFLGGKALPGDVRRLG